MACSEQDVKKAFFELIAFRDALGNLYQWCISRAKTLNEADALIEDAKKKFAELKRTNAPEAYGAFLESLDKIYRSRAFEDLIGLDVREVEGRIEEVSKYMKAMEFLNKCYEWRKGYKEKVIIEPLVISLRMFKKVRVPYTDFYQLYILFNRLKIRLMELVRILKLKDSVLKTFEHLYDLARITHSIKTERLALPKEQYSAITLITTKLSPTSMPFDISLKSVKNLFIEVNNILNDIAKIINELKEQRLVRELVDMLSK